ncbi:hypothetical protein JXB31_05845 [Candidatus Woesearchaeota archaeon]|nr:hypothetical protein [Candidatus Woesearchaeota archaeon]
MESIIVILMAVALVFLISIISHLMVLSSLRNKENRSDGVIKNIEKCMERIQMSALMFFVCAALPVLFLLEKLLAFSDGAPPYIFGYERVVYCILMMGVIGFWLAHIIITELRGNSMPFEARRYINNIALFFIIVTSIITVNSSFEYFSIISETISTIVCAIVLVVTTIVVLVQLKAKMRN